MFLEKVSSAFELALAEANKVKSIVWIHMSGAFEQVPLVLYGHCKMYHIHSTSRPVTVDTAGASHWWHVLR